jgi:hypothetical protein
MEIAKIYEYCKILTTIKEDFVVVGSMAKHLHAISTNTPNDLDIVVHNFDRLEGVINYVTPSPFSGSGKRGYILSESMVKIDIFVEYSLPKYQIVNGIRVAHPVAMLEYYENLLPKVAEHWKKGILNNINLLRLWQQTKI